MVRAHEARSRSRSSLGVVTEPSQRPGRSGAWKSEPAIGTRPIEAAHARQRSAASGVDGGPGDLDGAEAGVGQEAEGRLAEVIGRVRQPGHAPRARIRAIASVQASRGLGTSAGPPSPR